MAQRGDKHTDGWTDGKSPHSTGLCPLSGPLRKKGPKENPTLSTDPLTRPYEPNGRAKTALIADLILTGLEAFCSTSGRPNLRIR